MACSHHVLSIVDMPGTENYICFTCGVQHASREDGRPPEQCATCEDERQYVGWEGQRWTTLGEMKEAGSGNRFREVEPGLTSIDTRPRFAIGQRALLVQTEHGNFLWDCISYMDEETIEKVQALGGLHGISVSHPHFYGAMVEWSRAFNGAPIYVPKADAQWVMRPDSAMQRYERSHEVWPGLTLVQCGGHFDGSAALHWAAGAGGRGALLTGDTISVVADRRYVTFMRSYPNYIPLSAPAVRGVVAAVRPYAFERIYGGWWGTDVMEGGKEAIERSAERYVRRIEGGSRR